MKNPNRCKKVSGCKVASGPKRTFCRKAKNATRKRAASATKRSARRRGYARALSKGPWRGYNKKQIKHLKALGHKKPPTGNLHVPSNMHRRAWWW